MEENASTETAAMVAPTLVVDPTSPLGSNGVFNRGAVTSTTTSIRNSSEKRKSIKQEMKRRYLKYFMTGDDLSAPSTPSKKRPSEESASSQEEEASRPKLTISEAINEKFSSYNFTFGFSSFGENLSPVKHDKDGGVKVPTSLVLEACNVLYAGDPQTLCKYCSNVLELDLSHNDLQSWDEVETILNQMPHLRMLNLSANQKLGDCESRTQNSADLSRTSDASAATSEDQNKDSGISSDGTEPQRPPSLLTPDSPPLLSPCGGGQSQLAAAFRHDSLRTLVLNNTGAPIDKLAHFLPKLPSLQELHLSLNNYKNIANVAELQPHFGVKTLFFTDNHLDNWRDFQKLGETFPCLESLFLTSNKLPQIDISLEGLLPDLTSLHLAGNYLGSWECLDKLNDLSNLNCLRIYSIPFYDEYEAVTRLHLTIAMLKNVENLNGSKITEDNRIDAERFYIRYYLDAEEKPKRYYELVEKYGQLAKLGEVDLSPIEQIKVQLNCADLEMSQDIWLKPAMTVGQLKNYIGNIIGIRPKDFTLFANDLAMEEAFGPGTGIIELKLMSIQLSTAGIEDNSKLFVQVNLRGKDRPGMETSANEVFETNTSPRKVKLDRKTSDVAMQSCVDE